MTSMSTFKGLISRLTDGGRNVVIDLPKGGSIRAPNMGAFEIGDEVCFTLDVTGQKVVLVMPKDMAEWYDAKAENEVLQLSLKEDERGDIVYIDNDPDHGQVIEISVDRGGREPGEPDSDWADQSGYEHLDANADGFESESRVFSEGPGEADSILVPILLGHDDLQEMGDGPDKSVDDGWPPVLDAEGY